MAAQAAVFLTPARLNVVTLDTVQREHVTWLWPSRIPFGKLTVLEGDPGVGKGHLAMKIAAAVTTGHALPGGEHRAAADVVLVSLEDGLGDTLRPRAEAAGAALERIHTVTGVTGSDGFERLPTIPGDVALLAERVRETGAKLLILDPITAYVGSDTDTYKDQEVRRALLPLALLAEETGCAVIVVRHFTKKSGNKITAGGGSIAITGIARMVLMVAEHPDDPARRVLAVSKSNLAPVPDSLEFSIEDDGTGSRLVWGGRSDFTADTLHTARAEGANEEAGVTTECMDWLRDHLTGKDDTSRKDVLRAGKDNGFTDRTIDRAAKKLDVVKRRTGFQGHSTWALPQTDERPKLASSATENPIPAKPATVRGSGETGETGGTPQLAPIAEPPFGCSTGSGTGADAAAVEVTSGGWFFATYGEDEATDEAA